MLREAGAVGDDYDAWVVGPGPRRRRTRAALVDKARALRATARARRRRAQCDRDRSHRCATPIARRDAPTLATPHPAEAARLLGCDTPAVQADRVGAATELATELRAHVVLKGAGSIVARPDGTFDINASGNPRSRRRARATCWPACSARCSRRASTPREAMRIAVCLHGAAADCAGRAGHRPLGLTASEVIDAARALVNEATRKPAKR